MQSKNKSHHSTKTLLLRTSVSSDLFQHTGNIFYALLCHHLSPTNFPACMIMHMLPNNFYHHSLTTCTSTSQHGTKETVQALQCAPNRGPEHGRCPQGRPYQHSGVHRRPPARNRETRGRNANLQDCRFSAGLSVSTPVLAA